MAATATRTKIRPLHDRIIVQRLEESEQKIAAELIAAQGKPVDMGGYYRPDTKKTAAAMRPSPTLNAIIDAIA